MQMQVCSASFKYKLQASQIGVFHISNTIMLNPVLSLLPFQHLVPKPVKMEGPAQLLTLALVMSDGLECTAKPKVKV